MKKGLLFTIIIFWCIFYGSVQAYLYFPHVDANDAWDTEIAVINTSNDQTLAGTLNAYDDAGALVDSINVSLDPHARSEIAVDDSFDNPGSIGYIVLDTDAQDVQGYTKFFQAGKYRVAVPAVKDINIGDILVSHIDSSDDWWTGLAVVNTTDASVTLTITFKVADGAEAMDPVQRTLAANAHDAFLIRDLFDGIAQPDIESAVISDAAGVIGLSLFGSSGPGNQLSGVLLKDSTANTIYYPHVASDATWWTGMVATNTADAITSLDITPYDADGTALTPQVLPLDPMVKYIGTVDALNFPDGTAWLKIDADNPITGFELFGTRDENQLAGYTGVGIMAQAGVFPRIEKDGWTGIAFVNAGETAATLSLTAYDDSGTPIAVKTVALDGYAKVVDLAVNLFADEDISSATYIHYSCANEIVGFQLNGSADDMLLDGLPGLKAPLNLDDIDNDSDGVTENQGDCDDSDAGTWQWLTGYIDTDGDDYGADPAQNICSGASLPSPYVPSGGDCNDENDAINPDAIDICDDGIDQDCSGSDLSCDDVDNDGDGFTENNGDCNDEDETVWLFAYVDNDGDDRGVDTEDPLCVGIVPDGYAPRGGDCNDADDSVWRLRDLYVDADDDGYGTGTAQTYCIGSRPPGFSYDGGDCDDTNETVWQWKEGYIDNDYDNFGSGTLQYVCSGYSLPADYVDNNDDCDDTNDLINPYALEVEDGIDNNCNGEIDEPGTCTVVEIFHYPFDYPPLVNLYPPVYAEFYSTCGVNESTIQMTIEPRPLGTSVPAQLDYLGGTSYRIIWYPEPYQGLPSELINYEVTITFEDNEENPHTIYWDFFVDISDPG